NEIAQTKARYGTRLANFWMHGYFLQLGEARMSKSSGKFLRLQDAIDRGFEPLAYRFFCLSAHYRAKLNFTWEGLEGAAKAFDRLRTGVYELGPAGRVNEECVDQFAEIIADDLNMPRAVALAWEVLRGDLPAGDKKATLLFFDRVLGLGLANWQPPNEIIPEEIMTLVEQRRLARTEKRWKDADDLRNQVAAAGYEIEDTAQGPKVKRK
ncbi:MAG: cysteine--tRNA ligase, partial [Chloroflexota bacterium]